MGLCLDASEGRILAGSQHYCVWLSINMVANAPESPSSEGTPTPGRESVRSSLLSTCCRQGVSAVPLFSPRAFSGPLQGALGSALRMGLVFARVTYGVLVPNDCAGRIQAQMDITQMLVCRAEPFVHDLRTSQGAV